MIIVYLKNGTLKLVASDISYYNSLNTLAISMIVLLNILFNDDFLGSAVGIHYNKYKFWPDTMCPITLANSFYITYNFTHVAE